MTVTARFCLRCAAALPHHPPVACSACGYAHWVNPRPTGSVVIVDGPRFLAVRRAREPRAGWWDLPGGFCDAWELPADAAVREAREELGLGIRLDRFIGMYIGDYHYQDERLPVLDCFWQASIVHGDLTLDQSEASEYAWLPLAEPPPMAFVTQERALADLTGRPPAGSR
jgi:ADP-ribose pyrophosphatase YjhB (NUDIX family)